MSQLGQQKLLSYQFLPITDIVLHSQQQLKHLKHKGVLDNHVLEYNIRMQEFIHHNKECNNGKAESKKGKGQQNKMEFRKWAKDVDKVCAGNVKLTDIDKFQLYNNAVLGLITSEAELVLVLSKLLALSPKQRKILVQKCILQ